MPRPRSMANAMAQLLAASPSPVYAVDEQRKILFYNQACCDLIECDAQQLIDQRCDYRAIGESTTIADVAASLCPPPEAWSGQRTQADVSVLTLAGTLVRQRGEFLPLGSDPLGCVGVVGVLYDPLPETPTHQVAEVEAKQLHQQLMRLRQQIAKDLPTEELIGESPAMQRVREQVKVAVRSPVNTVICGPVGIDRGRIARAIHLRNTLETAGPLIPLIGSLLDAEGVQATIKSMVQQLSENTAGSSPCLLLVDVDELPDDAQAELAGFMSLPSFELYAVTTTRQPLTKLAREGKFLRDLACRLSTLVIELPSLGERPEDIPLLCQHHLEKFNAQGDKQLSGFTSEALDELSGYPWPDNLEELAEVVEDACKRADGPYVLERDLGDCIRWSSAAVAHPRRNEDSVQLDEFLADVERELLERAMAQSKGNKTKASELLSISRARLIRRLEQFGL